MAYPQDRLRRLRATAGLRRMVRETRLSVDNLIAPFFVVEGRDVRQPIASMPGQWRVAPVQLIKDAREGQPLGGAAPLVLGNPARTDEVGGEGGEFASVAPRSGRAADDPGPDRMG